MEKTRVATPGRSTEPDMFFCYHSQRSAGSCPATERGDTRLSPIAASVADVGGGNNFTRGWLAGNGSLSRGRVDKGGYVSSTPEALLADEAPIAEVEEFRTLIGEGQERGFLTFEEIAQCLEEVEVTKEQVRELHTYLEEHGIDVVGADGKPATSENGKVEAAARAARAPTPDNAPDAPKKPEIDLTIEPSLDSLRLYLRSIGRVELLTAEQEVTLAKRIERC